MPLPHDGSEPAHLPMLWCDRCGGVVDTSNKDHFHAEQCGRCRKFKRVDGDWGWCRNQESVYCGRLMFEHDTCSRWREGKW